MNFDISTLNKALTSFISKKCWWISFGGSAENMILLHIDKKIPRKHKLKKSIYPIDSYSGSKKIRTYNSYWEIKKNSEVIFSSKISNNELKLSEFLSLLINNYIKDIKIRKQGALYIYFDQNLVLEIHPDEKNIKNEDPFYIIDGGDNQRISIDHNAINILFKTKYLY